MSKRLTLLVLLFAALAVPNGALARTSQAEINKEKTALREKIREVERQAMELQAQIASGDRRKGTLEREIGVLAGRLSDADDRLAGAEVALGEAREEVFQVSGTLTKSLEAAHRARERLNDRVREVYRSGGPASSLEMVLEARDFRDFSARLEILGRTVSEDRRRLDDISKLNELIETQRNEALARKDTISQQIVALEQERANLEDIERDLQVAKQKVLAELSGRRSALASANSRKAEYLRQMAALEAQSRSLAALLKSAQRGQVYQAGAGRALAWPTTGSVSSGYGYRTHPIFGDRRLHAGIDISAPSGQSVIAAEGGKVVVAGSQSGYGLTVVIDHGNAVATVYAHLSAISVSNDANVARGNRVGSVGCTGYCTGPHLHFEVRVNGEPRDPMQFF